MFAGIAQLVERHFCKVDVRGSNPRAGSRKQKIPFYGVFFVFKRHEDSKAGPRRREAGSCDFSPEKYA